MMLKIFVCLRKKKRKLYELCIFEVTNVVKNITTESGIMDMKSELQGKHRMEIEAIVSFI